MISLVLLSGETAIAALAVPPAAQAASARLGIIVPLYSYPTDSSWSAMVQAKHAHPGVPFMAVVNPAGGPGSFRDPNYVTGIDSLRGAGIKVLGYVATDYASAPLSWVESQVSTWHSLYPIDGIFFDMMSNLAGTASYYSTLTRYTHSLIPGSTTLGNAGTRVPTALIGTTDILGVREDAGYPPLSFISYPGYGTGNFYMDVYGVSLDTGYLGQASSHVAWVYVTSLTLPDPYASLPWYFGSEVGYLASVDGSYATETVKSVDLSGATVTGLMTTFSHGGVPLASKFTTATYAGSIGDTYAVRVDNYRNYVFCHWQDGNTSPQRSVTLTRNVVSVAVYSTSGSCSANVNLAVRSDTTGGAPIYGLYTVVTHNGSPVAKGYTTMTLGAAAGSTYTVTVSNYGRYAFSHWSDGKTNPTISVTPTGSVTLVAYYNVS